MHQGFVQQHIKDTMKPRKTDIYYDAEGDYLEINVGNPRLGVFRDIGHDAFERVNEKTGRVLGVAILNFKKRTEKLKPISVPSKIEL